MTYWLLAVMGALVCLFWLRGRLAERERLRATQEKYLDGYCKPRVGFFDHEGHQILLLDLTYCTPQEAIQSLQEFKRTLFNQPAYSILTTLTIIDLTDGRFTPESIEEMKLVITESRRYLARARIGVIARRTCRPFRLRPSCSASSAASTRLRTHSVQHPRFRTDATEGF